MNAYKNSYWNGNGQFKAAYDELRKLIPVSGECPKECRALEKLRKATNCYYDLFNNGLCNRAREFRAAFGFSPVRKWDREIDYTNQLMNIRLNAKLDLLLIEAACENGLTRFILDAREESDRQQHILPTC